MLFQLFAGNCSRCLERGRLFIKPALSNKKWVNVCDGKKVFAEETFRVNCEPQNVKKNIFLFLVYL